MANEVNLEQVSQKIFQMSARRYRQLVNERDFPPVKEGLIDFVAASAAVCKYYKDLAVGQGSMTLTDERSRLTKINADRKELMLRKERGELIETEKAMYLWGQVAMVIRSKLLSFPTKLAPLVLGYKSLVELKAVIEKFIEEVLIEVANPNLKDYRVAIRGGSDKNVKAATKANHKSMGRQRKGIKSRK